MVSSRKFILLGAKFASFRPSMYIPSATLKNNSSSWRLWFRYLSLSRRDLLLSITRLLSVSVIKPASFNAAFATAALARSDNWYRSEIFAKFGHFPLFCSLLVNAKNLLEQVHAIVREEDWELVSDRSAMLLNATSISVRTACCDVERTLFLNFKSKTDCGSTISMHYINLGPFWST